MLTELLSTYNIILISMDDPTLWIEKYKPRLNNIPQDGLKKELNIGCESGINLVISGQKGVGKTAMAELITEKSHKNPDSDVININISDIFNRTKEEISSDPRFSNFLSSTRKTSKRDIIQNIVKNYASYPPVTGGYKTIIINNMENARRDFQESLRRTIETHTNNVRFIITTRNQSNLIDPIKSRCYSIHIRPPNSQEINEIASRILDDESIDYTEESIDYIWSQTKPNVRKFLLHLQSVHINYNSINIDNARDHINEVSKRDQLSEIISLGKNKDYKQAKKEIEEIINEDGYSKELLLEELVEVSFSELDDKKDIMRFCSYASVTDVEMRDSTDPVPHILELLTNIES